MSFFFRSPPETDLAAFEFLTETMKNEERLLFRHCPPLGEERSFPFLLTL